MGSSQGLCSSTDGAPFIHEDVDGMLLEGFYGGIRDDVVHAPENLSKIIRHCHNNCNKWIKADPSIGEKLTDIVKQARKINDWFQSPKCAK